MKNVTRAELLWTLLFGSALVASAFSLVDLRHQMRHVYIEHENEMTVHSRLSADQAELEMKVRRASLAANISAGAGFLGMQGATGADTVTLVEKSDGTVDFLPEIRSELDAIEERESGDEGASQKGDSPREAGGRS